MLEHDASKRPSFLTLATDLDGTLLAGSPAARRRIRELFTLDPSRRLIFVTGRGLESVLPLLGDPGVPRPHWIIADVGATIVSGDTLRAVQPLQGSVANIWPGTLNVLEALAPFEGLQRQDVPQEHRCSFLCAEEDITDALRDVVENQLGCDLLFSAGRYLDVLPRGVNKGSTLLALAKQEGLPLDGIVVAGDTLNDLSLFETGLAGVVVGAAEAGLVHAVRGRDKVFVARREGCGGIVDGLAHHGFVEQHHQEEPVTAGESKLVMVYHRLPFDEVEVEGKVVWRAPKSPNGIIPTLLGFFGGGLPGSWVAWSRQSSRAPEAFESRVALDPEKFPALHVARVPLTADDIDLFYKRFSKEAFWPIIFSFPDRAEFDESHWRHYLEINRIFAERAAREAALGALVWVHDYNLWMVPAFLRTLRPDLKIAFFHHTAFPAPDVFNVIPWRRDILGSLLQCDYVGFHVPRYVENFVGAVRSHAPCTILETQSCAPRWLTYGCALGTDTVTTRLQTGERTVHLGAHPVGIDVDAIGTLLKKPSVRKRIDTIRDELRNRVGILSIERLDYVKGTLEKLIAFEHLLERRPELRTKVVMLNIITPAAPGMEVYETLRTALDEAVGRINGRFSTLDWTPIRYFFRSLPYEDVVAHYAACDVAWITPLRDGLNMVAKEYVATQAAEGRAGVLVLSEFAGAAVELHGALLTNPYDPAEMEKTLHHAITLAPEARGHRMDRLSAIVKTNDVKRWGDDFLGALKAL